MTEGPSPSDEAEELATEATTQPAPEAQTAEVQPEPQSEEESEWKIEEVPAARRKALLDWANSQAQIFHRKKVHEAGYAVAKVPESDREELRKNPQLIAELRAERDAFRRAAANGGTVTGQGHVETKPKPEESRDTSEADAREFLESQGYSESDTGYQDLLKFKTREFRFLRTKGYLASPNVGTPPDVDKIVDERITKREADRIKAVNEREYAEIQQSTDWTRNDGTPNYEFRGRLGAKCEQLKAEGILERYTIGQVADLVRQEMSPAKAALRPKPSGGEVSSAKVGSSMSSNPWAKHDEELKRKGIRAEDF